MNFPAFLNTVTTRNFSLPIVILYVTAGCNLKCIMCSYRDPLPNELSLDELRELATKLHKLGLRHIVYSGGEPLTRRDFPVICDIFGNHNVKQSLLTNGLLLHKRYEEIQPFFNEIIVSIDGPTAEVHNRIRGVEAFDQIIKGVEKVVSSHPRPKISIRTVIQRMNFRNLSGVVELAKSLGVDRISFLAADVLSNAFHRDYVGPVSEPREIMLNEAETHEFRKLMEEFVEQHRVEIETGFISENPAKLRYLVQYFEALLGQSPFPRNHCNAPMTSTVIGSDGTIYPCFFLPSFGNVRSGVLKELLNNIQIQETRQQVRNYTLERCHTCVCTLNVQPASALLDRF